MLKNWQILLIILIFAAFGTKALISPGLFTAHDIWHQVARIYHYYQAVQDGQFPPYWIASLANGYGYPLFIFSYHLPWMISIPFLKFGLDIPTTIKTLFFISFLSSGISMYFFVKSLLKNSTAALLSAVLYLWAPYHFLVIFISASMGIAFIFTFLPLLLLGINLIRSQNNVGPLILALGISGIILSHIMHVFFLLPLILIFYTFAYLTSEKRVEFVKNTFFGIALGLALSSFYLIPATYYKEFTKVQNQVGGPKNLYESNFVNFKQLVYSKWGVSPITTDAKDGEISFQIGISQWLSILAVIFLLTLGSLSKNTKKLSIYLLFGFAVSIFFMLDYSKSIWKTLERFIFLDYPFRLILPTLFIGSVLSAVVLVSLRTNIQKIFLIIIVLIALYTNRNHINVNQYTDIPLSSYVESEITTNSFHEYLPSYADSRLLGEPYIPAEGEDILVSSLDHKPNKLSLDITTEKEATVSIGQFYFPGQTLYVNGEKSEYDVDNRGRIVAKINSGTNQIVVKYEQTILMKISKIISAAALLILLWTLFFRIRRITS